MDPALDAYAILDVRKDADTDEIHDSEDAMRQLNVAYETLRNPVARAAYTEKRSKYLQQQKPDQRAPRVADVVDLDAMDAVQKDAQIQFVYPCRCGQQYTLHTEDAARGVEYVACTGCSEVIRINYTEG
ncbi:hypothetical protein MVES1_003929 [Malassezia vespertilionis]|uniref:uncharacterized protein n=1 Tax=Malassezia vespertilionis TaxID=2020962 RepID=UPI0024B1BAC2|nr:uncharacterized protein MVES1_003929 [Malassezia vespertilionis]WFD08553.1 hypothetical protein MVES1_003929 [Malassezia vespertilionis]